MKRLDRQAAASFYVTLYSIIAPFRVGIGLGLMVTSMLVVSTVGVVCIDRFFHSACGFECGYLLENNKETMPNLIDMIMVKASHFFPLDYLVFLAIGLYIFLASAHGLARIGIRVLGIQIFKIRRRRTSSQGLLLSSVMLGITALAVSVTLLSIAPQYVSFGAQVYMPTEGGERRPCEMEAIVGEEASCRLTNFARFVGTQALNNRLFSLAFFYGQVAFVAISLISLLHAFCRRRDGTFQNDDLSEDEDDELDDGGMEVLGEELEAYSEERQHRQRHSSDDEEDEHSRRIDLDEEAAYTY